MVVGGFPDEVCGKAEIYELRGQNTNCPSINDFSIDYGSVGTFINNKALVCGGEEYIADYSSECFSYNMQVKLKNKL